MRGTLRLLATLLIAGLFALGSTLFPPGPAAAGSTPTVVFVDGANGHWQMDGIGSFYYGIGGDLPLLCDWNGDGVDTVGVFRSSSGEMHLRNSNTWGVSDRHFYYGSAGDLPVCGDWNGTGKDTIGIYRPSAASFFLRNTNTYGAANITFQLAPTGGVPFAGDFDGDGIDTVGLWDPANGTFQVSEGNRGRVALRGQLAGDQIVVGDWDNDGRDTIAAYDRATGKLTISDVGDVEAVVPLGARSGTPLAGSISARRQVELYDASRAAPTTTTTTAPRATTTTSTTAATTTTTTAPRATTTTTTAPPPPAERQAAPAGDVWGLFVSSGLLEDPHLLGVLDQYDAILTQWSPRTFDQQMRWASNNGLKVMYSPAGTSWFREPDGWTEGPGGSRLNLAKWRDGVVDRYVEAGVDFDYWTKEGTLLGIYLIDEPLWKGSWGAPIPGKTLDVDMAGYLNRFFPKTRTYVRAAPSQLPKIEYKYLDGGWSQWTWSRGFSYNPKEYHGVDWWVRKELRAADARGFNRENLVWGMAILHGGQPNDATGFGLPTRDPYHGGSSQGGTYMRPEEILEVARAIQSAPGIGAFLHRYDTADWTSRLPGDAQTEWLKALETAARNAG